jgi:iron transport multicopper oxidase
VYLSTVEQATVNMGVDPATGVLTQQDYFEPYAYDGNNGGDLDFGSAGVALLDPTVFNGTGVNRIAVAGGKDGKVYIMNADNLGGFAGGKLFPILVTTRIQELLVQTMVGASSRP